MKTTKPILLFFAIYILIVQTSCTSEDDAVALVNTELIVGEWLVTTEHDYHCGTNEIFRERLTDPQQTSVYKEDGTWKSFNSGIPSDWTGTWQSIGDNRYSIYYTNDEVTENLMIEFPNSNTMNFGMGECYEVDGEMYDTWTVWLRQ